MSSRRERGPATNRIINVGRLRLERKRERATTHDIAGRSGTGQRFECQNTLFNQRIMSAAGNVLRNKHSRARAAARNNPSSIDIDTQKRAGPSIATKLYTIQWIRREGESRLACHRKSSTQLGSAGYMAHLSFGTVEHDKRRHRFGPLMRRKAYVS